MKTFFKFEVTLSWSKIMALVIVALAFIIDIMYEKSGTVFMYVIPFVVFLITGKQYLDKKK